MTYPHITDIRALPFGRLPSDRDFGRGEYGRGGSGNGLGLAGALHRAADRLLPGLHPKSPTGRSPRDLAPDHVLPAEFFARALERERSLADRGTRRFSLVVLRRRAQSREERREREGLGKLAGEVCRRLRSTDLVGRPDPDRVEILLTDTEPAGAHVVATWIEQIQGILRLDLELTIFVYPTVDEPRAAACEADGSEEHRGPVLHRDGEPRRDGGRDERDPIRCGGPARDDAGDTDGRRGADWNGQDSRNGSDGAMTGGGNGHAPAHGGDLEQGTGARFASGNGCDAHPARKGASVPRAASVEHRASEPWITARADAIRRGIDSAAREAALASRGADPKNGLRSDATANARTPSAPIHAPMKSYVPGGARNGRHPKRSWPMQDLWPRLGVPTPAWKRCVDIVISSAALLALSPLLGLIALAIRVDSRGPVFFRQQRAGLGGRPFSFYKFRSMVADAESQRAALASRNEKDGPIFKIRRDPRITRVGRLLRRWSLDELPQLWNVLKGDISLVGPRSPTFDEVCQYERWQRRRLSVIGGITCFWQVSGRSEISFRDWMRLDMRYIACRNLWVDLRLLGRTVPAVITGRGAC